MGDIFASAKSVLRRADYHITDLKTKVRGFAPGKPYTYRADYDPEIGKYVHKAIFSESFSDDVSCILFDAINNLRAALDQLTFAVAAKHCRSDEIIAYFPFASDIDHWPDRINGLKNKLPAEVCAVFEGLKPYKGGNDALWALNYIANIKKHRVLMPAGFGGKMISMPTTLTESASFRFGRRKPFGEDTEIELCITNEVDLESKIQIAFTVVIRDAEPIIDRKDPVTLLQSIRPEVGFAFAQTEQTCRKIGLVV